MLVKRREIMKNINLSRRNFLLMCGVGLAGFIGGATINQNTSYKEKYITNVEVNQDEFLFLENKQSGRFYIALSGDGIIQGSENDFIEELLNKNIIPYDACDIHTLPKANEEMSHPFSNLSITTEDSVNYTLSSEDESLISSLQKHHSDVLAQNNELLNSVKTR